jgi:hypothetical protein
VAKLSTFFDGALRDYARRQRDAGRITIHLPSGTLSTRPVGGNVQVVDEAKVLAWLPAEVRGEVVKESVRLSVLQKLVSPATFYEHHYTVACGEPGDRHSTVVLLPRPELGYEVGEIIVCPVCSAPGPILYRSVGDSVVVPAYQGDPVPGAAVVPSDFNATVKPS